MNKLVSTIEPLEARIAPAFDAVLQLSGLDGLNGFKINGVAPSDNSGWWVSDAGDVNGDGFADVLIAAPFADANGNDSGASYVIFGKAAGFSATLDLSNLDGINGFKLSGQASNDRSGFSVSGTGDVNGDGFDDLLIGAYGSDANGIQNSGVTYVVFGKAAPFAATLNLSTLSGTDGFKLNGQGLYDQSGRSVSGAGDVNGDGFDDILIGAPSATNAGASYVVFGNDTAFASTLNLSTLNGVNGFRINGAPGDFSGSSVSAAGDVNGDGFDDLLIGASQADPNGFNSGTSYLVFGKNGGFAPAINLSTLNGLNGFKINGVGTYDESGGSVSAAGDVNGDGLDDLLIGAAFTPNGSRRGAGYVIFGRTAAFAATLELSVLNGANGFTINGAAAGDLTGFSVRAAGDINADGFDDLLIGASEADPNGSNSGASYLVFGKAAAFADHLNLATLNGTDGFRINGVAPGDLMGRSVSTAGDVNGDGFDDLLIGAFYADPHGSASGASYVIFGGPTATIAINDISSVEGDSGATDLKFTVSLSGASTVPVSVRYRTLDGTAQTGSDFIGIASELLIFAPGETSKSITALVTGDTTHELDEALLVVLAEPRNATIVTGTGTGTIRNDDAAPLISIAAGSVIEGDTGASGLSFTASLSEASGLPASVNFASVPGTAIAGGDYAAPIPGTLTFAPGETSKTITVEVSGDSSIEDHETFSVALSGADGATIDSGTATGTILNDDTLVRIADATLLEGHSGTRTMTFTVSLAAATALPVSVNFTSADGSATRGTDYTAITPGTLNFAPSEMSKTLTIDVLGDTVVEPIETFSVVLSDANNAVLDQGTGLGTILDDDVTLAGTRKATFTDVDGELVTIKVSQGTLKVEDFTIFPSGIGAQLALVDLSGETEFAGAKLSITAKAPRGVAPGDRLAHVGYINATGIDLGKVLVKGVLGQIDAGDDLTPAPGLLSLSVQSIGRSGLLTQLPGGSLQSDIAGGLNSVKSADGVHDAVLSVGGDIGSIKITGDVLGSAIRSDGKIGAITITGDLAASASGSATISARGDLAATTAGNALAIRSISIGGSVDQAQILAGYDRSGAAVNGDASIGPVTVRRDWMASDLVAGSRAGADSLFGTDDDALISNATPLIARIASIVVKGTASGSTNPAEHSGFVSQQNDVFQSGGAKLPLTTGPSTDLAGLPVGSTGNLRVREVG